MSKINENQLREIIREEVNAVVGDKKLPKGYTKCAGCGTIIKEGLKCNNPECSTYKNPEDKDTDELFLDLDDGEPEPEPEKK